MKNPRINYVLATWSGQRRPGHTKNGNLTYQHFQYLERTQHQLSQITVGWPNNPKEPTAYSQWMQQLNGKQYNGASVVVEAMKNEGYSYSQYSKIYAKHSDFDYFIFTEDDYLPVIDNFDVELVRMFEEERTKNNCGYLCGLVEKVGFRRGRKDGPYHAAISWGITSSEVLKRIGEIPFDKKGHHQQVVFSCGFTNAGYTLQDVLKEYCCPYYRKSTTLEYHGDSEKPVIVAPIQYAIQSNLYKVAPMTPFS